MRRSRVREQLVRGAARLVSEATRARRRGRRAGATRGRAGSGTCVSRPTARGLRPSVTTACSRSTTRHGQRRVSRDDRPYRAARRSTGAPTGRFSRSAAKTTSVLSRSTRTAPLRSPRGPRGRGERGRLVAGRRHAREHRGRRARLDGPAERRDRPGSDDPSMDEAAVKSKSRGLRRACRPLRSGFAPRQTSRVTRNEARSSEWGSGDDRWLSQQASGRCDTACRRGAAPAPAPHRRRAVRATRACSRRSSAHAPGGAFAPHSSRTCPSAGAADPSTRGTRACP